MPSPMRIACAPGVGLVPVHSENHWLEVVFQKPIVPLLGAEVHEVVCAVQNSLGSDRLCTTVSTLPATTRVQVVPLSIDWYSPVVAAATIRLGVVRSTTSALM